MGYNNDREFIKYVAVPLAKPLVKPIVDAATPMMKPVITKGYAALMTKFGVMRGTENITLYRAVGPEELQQISQTKIFKNPYGIENKYFSTTQAGAEQYAEMAEKAFGDPPYRIIKTTISKSVFESLSPELKNVVDRGVPAALIPTPQLSALSQPEIISHELELLNRRIP